MSVHPKFGYNCCLFSFTPIEKYSWVLYCHTHFQQQSICVTTLAKNFVIWIPTPSVVSLSFFFALQLIRLLFLFAIPIFKQNTKALCKTHHHQGRTEQTFILQGHMPLGERITIGNDFCKNWYFWKPARGEDPKCLTHSSFSDFVLREKGFNITVWDSTVSSKGLRSYKSTVTAVRKLSFLLRRILCSPIHN